MAPARTERSLARAEGTVWEGAEARQHPEGRGGRKASEDFLSLRLPPFGASLAEQKENLVFQGAQT